MAARINDVKAIADAAVAWLRTEASRAGDVAGENVGALLRELGFVSRDAFDDLALRVAQLEHRVRLLESASQVPARAQTPEPAAARTEPDLPSTPTS